MRKVIIVFAVIAALTHANGFRLEDPVYVGGGTDDRLQYDDGSAHWLTWDGHRRGVWFDIQDFLPGAPYFFLDNTEYWFYHHSSYPWDAGEFYAEVWTDSASAPGNRLDQATVTAIHYSAVYANYPMQISTDRYFWAIVNTEMSIGGWPSLLGDNTPNITDHSFYLEGTAWQPWVITGSVASDYLIMATGGTHSLDGESWGAIKGLFR